MKFMIKIFHNSHRRRCWDRNVNNYSIFLNCFAVIHDDIIFSKISITQNLAKKFWFLEEEKSQSISRNKKDILNRKLKINTKSQRPSADRSNLYPGGNEKMRAAKKFINQTCKLSCIRHAILIYSKFFHFIKHILFLLTFKSSLARLLKPFWWNVYRSSRID